MESLTEIRETKIIYDELLFDYLDRLKTKYKLTNGHNCSHTERFFYQLWEDTDTFIQNTYGLKSNHADKFSLIVALLSDYRSFDKWEDVINDDWTFYDFPNAHGGRCCCNHRIHNAYVMKNTNTGMSVIVGSECVKSRMITNTALQTKREAAVKRANKRRRVEKAEAEEMSQQDDVMRVTLFEAMSYPHAKVNWGRWRGTEITA